MEEVGRILKTCKQNGASHLRCDVKCYKINGEPIGGRKSYNGLRKINVPMRGFHVENRLAPPCL